MQRGHIPLTVQNQLESFNISPLLEILALRLSSFYDSIQEQRSLVEHTFEMSEQFS